MEKPSFQEKGMTYPQVMEKARETSAAQAARSSCLLLEGGKRIHPYQWKSLWPHIKPQNRTGGERVIFRIEFAVKKRFQERSGDLLYFKNRLCYYGRGERYIATMRDTSILWDLDKERQRKINITDIV